jgi:hypothetical protein
MRLTCVRFTIREVLIAILATGIFLAWIVGWERLRVGEARERARAILTEDTGQPFSTYSTTQDAVAASERASEKARMWVDGLPSSFVIVGGAIVDLFVVGLALAISNAISARLRRARRKREQWQRREE